MQDTGFDHMAPSCLIVGGGGHAKVIIECLRSMKHPGRSFLVAPGYTEDEVARVSELVREAGFGDVQVLRGHAGRECASVRARGAATNSSVRRSRYS